MNKFQVRLIFLGCLVLFMVQETVIRTLFDEPYPALRMPPFSGTGMNESGFYQASGYEIIVAFEDDTSVAISQHELFDAPDSHHWVLVRNFTPVDTTRRHTTAASRLEPIRFIAPGLVMSRTRTIYEVQRHPDTRAFLLNRIGRIYPDRVPYYMDVNWYTERYHPGSLLEAEREYTGSTRIQLQ
jgi:hypothetical protein